MKGTKIYDQTVAVIARKGKGHKCDAKCMAANHTYIHRFKKKSNTQIVGSPKRKGVLIGRWE